MALQYVSQRVGSKDLHLSARACDGEGAESCDDFLRYEIIIKGLQILYQIAGPITLLQILGWALISVIIALMKNLDIPKDLTNENNFSFGLRLGEEISQLFPTFSSEKKFEMCLEKISQPLAKNLLGIWKYFCEQDKQLENSVNINPSNITQQLIKVFINPKHGLLDSKLEIQSQKQNMKIIKEDNFDFGLRLGEEISQLFPTFSFQEKLQKCLEKISQPVAKNLLGISKYLYGKEKSIENSLNITTSIAQNLFENFPSSSIELLYHRLKRAKLKKLKTK